MNSPTFEEFLDLCDGVLETGPGKFRALCPCHHDHNPSLYFERGSTAPVVAYCMVCREAAPFERIVAALRSGTWANGHVESKPVKRIPWGRCVAVHTYRHPDGRYAYDKLRFRFTDPETGEVHKQTPYRRMPPGSDPGEEVWGRGDLPALLYNLHEIASAEPSRTIYCFEGESDVDTATSLGLTATCTDGGAWEPGTKPKWSEAFETPLHGFQHVAICRDNDAPGLEYATHWASRLHGHVGTVRILTLPGLKPKGDFRDWVEAGGTVEEFIRLANVAPIFTPETSLEKLVRVEIGGFALLSKEIPEPESLIGNGLLSKSDLGMLIGEGGAGKSQLAVQLAVARAFGTSWIGFPVDQGRTGLLMLELNDYRWQQRIKVAAGERASEALDQIRVVCRPDLSGVLDLSGDTDMAALRHWIISSELSLVILDPLSRAHGLDENKIADISPFFQRLDALRHDTGCTIVINHHTRKAQGNGHDSDLDAGSGSRAFRDFPSFYARLVRKSSNVCVLNFGKVSNTARPQSVWLLQGEDGVFDVTESPERIGDKNREKVREVLLQAGEAGITAKELEQRIPDLKSKAIANHRAALGAIPDKQKPPRYRLSAAPAGAKQQGDAFEE